MRQSQRSRLAPSLSRRQVLRGAGGFALAIPFLSSLEPRGAKAQTAQNDRRFIAFGTHHGAVWGASMFPPNAVANQTANYAGHTVRRGTLPLDVSGGVASICPTLSGDATILTPALAAKLNVIRGLDVSFYIGHHTGGHLGNYARNDANGGDGGTVNQWPRPTIDQVMAWSPSFYSDLSTILMRSMVIGDGRLSYGWSSPQTQSGTIQEIASENSSMALFNNIFVPEEDPEEEKRPPIVDRVLEDYKRLRNSSQRLSSTDRQRLDDHLERLDELERKLKVQVSCGDIEPPLTDSTDEYGSSYSIDPEAQKRFFQLFNDVIVAAMVCGTSRVATINVGETFSSFVGDWHQDIAHQAGSADGAAQAVIAAAHQRFFEDVYLDLVAKLDAIEDGTGGTLLDKTLVQWTQESGSFTHDSISVPVITAGSAGGAITTGQYLDYRNMSRIANQDPASGETTHTGLCYNQYLANVLLAMGLTPDEFEEPGTGGYGVLHHSTETWYGGYDNYNAAVYANLSDWLPFLEA